MTVSLFALGAIDPIWPDKVSAFQRPAFVTSVPLLDDGTGSVTEALQSGSNPRKRATWDLGRVTDADLALLQGYHSAVTAVSCVTLIETLTVVILDLPPADMVAPGLWTISGMVLIEIP